MTDISFLSGGPSVSITRLPEGFHPVPVLESPLGYRGQFARSLVFYPEVLETDILRDVEKNSEAVESLTRDNNASRGFYNANAKFTFVRWEVGGGAVYTHLLDDDAVNAGDLLEHVEILDEGPHPVVLPTSPFAIEARSTPGYEESITFFKLASGTAEVIGTAVIRRPAWIRSTVSRTLLNEDGTVTHERGATDLIDIRLTNVGDEEETARFSEELVLSIRSMR